MRQRCKIGLCFCGQTKNQPTKAQTWAQCATFPFPPLRCWWKIYIIIIKLYEHICMIFCLDELARAPCSKTCFIYSYNLTIEVYIRVKNIVTRFCDEPMSMEKSAATFCKITLPIIIIIIIYTHLAGKKKLLLFPIYQSPYDEDDDVVRCVIYIYESYMARLFLYPWLKSNSATTHQWAILKPPRTKQARAHIYTLTHIYVHYYNVHLCVVWYISLLSSILLLLYMLLLSYYMIIWQRQTRHMINWKENWLRLYVL